MMQGGTPVTEVVMEHHDADCADIKEGIKFKPEESWNYELGTHANLFNNLIHADLSLFYMQIRNQQLSVFTEDYGYGRKMVNAGKSYSCGLELTLRGSAVSNHLNWGLAMAIRTLPSRNILPRPVQAPRLPRWTIAARGCLTFRRIRYRLWLTIPLIRTRTG